MREIDAQSEARLKRALQRLAAASPQSLPAEVSAELLGKFRRHHARRRWIRRSGMLALAAAITLAAVWSSRNHWQRHPDQNSFAKATTGNEEKLSSAPNTVVAATAKRGKKTSARPRSTRRITSAANRAFLALPAYDPTVPMEDLQVVRVQLPASALWKLGAPVAPDVGERRMTADFVVGQDGTAYAVRLVQ